MNEKEIGKSLLQLNALELAGVPDARQQTWNVLERDRRRVRFLTIVTILLWLLAAVMLIVIFYAYALMLPKHVQFLAHIEQKKVDEQTRDRVQAFHQLGTLKLTVHITLAIGLLALAALATIFLVLASRRATLRQVNASLLEISEQLKLLRNPAEGQASGPT